MASRNRPTSTTSPNESRSAAGSPGARCGAVRDRVAQFPEPGQGGVFDDGFVEAHFFRQALRKVFVVTFVEGRPGAFQNVHDLVR